MPMQNLVSVSYTHLDVYKRQAQPGYVRTLKQCLYVDKAGKMQEMELVVEFIRGYISAVSYTHLSKT